MSDFAVIKTNKTTTIKNWLGGGTVQAPAGAIVGILPFGQKLPTSGEIAIPYYFIRNKNGNLYEEGKVAHYVNAKDVYIEDSKNTYFKGSYLGRVAKLKPGAKGIRLYEYSGDQTPAHVWSSSLFGSGILGDFLGTVSLKYNRYHIQDKQGKKWWISPQDFQSQLRTEGFSADALIEKFNQAFVKPLAAAHEQTSQAFTNTIQKPLEELGDKAGDILETGKIMVFGVGLFLLLSKLK